MRIRISLVISIVFLVLCGCGSGGDDGDGPHAARVRPNADPSGMITESHASRVRNGLLPEGGPTEEDYPHLHNLLQVSERIYSGGEPQDEEAFAELAALGVRTIVSVDGARPNLEAAERHGLQYVHIPIGYDGINEEAGLSFARLVLDADAPFYVHCHHGTHRGPAAAAIVSIADGCATPETALAILEKAGTSENYGGLWQDVAAYATPEEGVQLPELVSIAEVESLAATMTQIDRASDHLNLCAAEEWTTPADHSDISPTQEALLLKEGFRETVRQLMEENDYDEQFLAWMQEAEETATRLEAAMEAGQVAEITEVFAEVREQCQQCHGEYRD